MPQGAEIVERVMEKVEQFYMGEGEQSGEAIFNEFAAKHASLFEGDFHEDDQEQKLEYTSVFNEYQALFESHIERMIQDCDVSIQGFFGSLQEE